MQRFEEYMQLAFRFLLCISAYIPLFIILVLKNINNLEVCAVLIIVFIFIPILDVTDDNGENITLLVERKLDVPKYRNILVRMISPGIYLYGIKSLKI